MSPAAKSTENLSKDSNGDDEVESGFGRTLSPTPMVARSAADGRKSPGSEMLTLEQFLKEANKEAADVEPSPRSSVSWSNSLVNL